MTSGPEGLAERPLVTFALFAYNQERFVKDAIEGAFSQTYEPLEIILSDDCSTDRTFEFIQEMAANYCGPHKLVINRTPVNGGTLRHISNAISKASGKLIVVAAGDDISSPNRAECLYVAWKNSGAWGLFSKFDIIDEFGGIKKQNMRLSATNIGGAKFIRSDKSLGFIHGATSAYDIRLFGFLPETKKVVLHEDAVFSLLINLIGQKIHFCDKSLVRYREHDFSLSNNNRASNSIETLRLSEQRENGFAKYFLNLVDYIIQELVPFLDKDFEKSSQSVDYNFIGGYRNFYALQAEMTSANFSARIGMLFRFRSAAAWRWVIPRLFGINVLFLCKKHLKYVFKSDLTRLE